MLASPGQSPRQIIPPSPSPSADSRQGYGPLALASTSERSLDGSSFGKKRKKSSQVSLDEDTYVAAIEKIIERDFFPDIPKLQNRLEWLEAVRSGDPIVIRDAQLNIIQRRRDKAREQGERDGTPATVIADTPNSMISGLASPAVSLRSAASPSMSMLFPPSSSSLLASENGTPVETNLKLDEFLKKYTSEDNASFSKIIEKVNKQRKQKYEYLSEKELVDSNLRIEGQQPGEFLPRKMWLHVQPFLVICNQEFYVVNVKIMWLEQHASLSPLLFSSLLIA
jgi:protein DGCR14